MIELRNISKTYVMGKVEVRALQGVSLSIAAGEFVAIMGPSGSGKSTMMHLIGLLDRPDEGEYYLCGKPVQSLSDDEAAALRNRMVGFIFQQFHLLPRMSALENAALPLLYAGKTRSGSIARKNLEMVGLAERISHNPNELSGGQQQRVAIARALVNDPLLILADEPTGNLDSKAKEEIILLLKELNRQGKTIVIVTHENEVAAHARRVIVMRDGKITSDKTAQPEAGPKKGPVPCLDDSPVRSAKRAEFTDFLRQAVFAMTSHKARSFLSILGILIGVGAVIAMLALGQGAKVSIESRLASLGSNMLLIRPGSARVHGVALESGSVTRFTMQDVLAIKAQKEYVSRVSASVSGRGQLVYGSENWNTQVEGVDVDYEAIRNTYPPVGRFFTVEEVKAREKVCLLGPTVAKELFGENNPVGQTLKINLINFRVIGVLPAKGAAGFRDQDDTVVIPVTTAMYRLLGKEYLDTIYVEASSAVSMDAAQEQVEAIIRKQHRLKPTDDTFEIRNMSDIRQTLESTTRTMSMLLGAIAAISLLVGGIGIMNIMLVSVTERTREIGLRKAIGATNSDIMLQFLVEAVLMSFVGGVLGIAIGCATAVMITVFAGWTVSISASSIVLATAFSFAVGVIFGLWPARQASRLDPIEALRYE